MSWKHAPYIKDLSKITNPTPASIVAVAEKHFPILAKKTTRSTPGSRFIKTIKEIFATKTTDAKVIEALRTIFPLFQVLFPVVKTLSQRLSDVRKVIKKHQSAEAYQRSQHDDVFNQSSEVRGNIIKKYKKLKKAGLNTNGFELLQQVKKYGW